MNIGKCGEKASFKTGKGLLFSAFASLLAITAAAPADAAYEDLGAGARAPGMGNAFAAVADDVYAIHYNPAGLGWFERPQLGAAYSKLYMGLSDKSDLGTSFLGYVHPLREGKNGTVGAAWNAFTLNSIYREDTFYASYGRMLQVFEDGSELGGGVNLKLLRSSFGSFPESSRATSGLTVTTTPDPVLSGNFSQTSFDTDLGFLYRFARHYALGLQMTHVNQPNVAFSSGDTDKLPLGVKLGFNYGSKISNLIAQYETQRSPAGSRDSILTFAAERWFPRLLVGEFGARGGFGFGSREFAQLALGLSYRARRLGVDYGFALPIKGVSGTAGSHRFAVSFRFGRASDEEEGKEMILEAMREMKSGTPVHFRVSPEGLSESERLTAEEHLAHARLMEISGRYYDAQQRLALALKVSPKDKDLLVHADRLHTVLKYWTELLSFKIDPVQAALHQGIKAYLAGQDDIAVRKVSTALALAPENKEIGEFLAQIEKAGNVRRPPIQPVLKPKAILTTLTKAEAALEERRYSEAIELAMEALREDENSIDAWQILGTAYFALQDHENALDAWRKVLNLEKSPTVRETIKRHIRSIERMAGRRRGEGMKPPEPKPAAPAPAPVQRSKLSSGEIQSLYQRGIEAYTGGDSTGAKEAFEAIIEADPMNVEAQKALKRIRDEERAQ